MTFTEVRLHRSTDDNNNMRGNVWTGKVTFFYYFQQNNNDFQHIYLITTNRENCQVCRNYSTSAVYNYDESDDGHMKRWRRGSLALPWSIDWFTYTEDERGTSGSWRFLLRIIEFSDLRIRRSLWSKNGKRSQKCVDHDSEMYVPRIRMMVIAIGDKLIHCCKEQRFKIKAHVGG